MKMKRWKFYPCKFSKICSDHFTPDCINPGVGFGKPTLKQNAIHNYFQFFTTHQRKVIKKTKNTLNQNIF
ncbi:BTB/POZ domain-containing protein 9 [Armadillidium vulgare]|nr:BTB/POZ domain-containing protein 9 [Armadillidium vulgare]